MTLTLWSDIAREWLTDSQPQPSAGTGDATLDPRVHLARNLTDTIGWFPDTYAGLRWAVRTINVTYDCQFTVVAEETSLEH